MLFFRTIISFLKDEDYRNLFLTTTAILGIGGVVYHFLEGWSWVDSFYFSVITLTTIGYGDLAPKTDAGKIFTMLYILVGLGIILSFINTTYRHYNSVRIDRKSNKRKNDEGK